MVAAAAVAMDDARSVLIWTLGEGLLHQKRNKVSRRDRCGCGGGGGGATKSLEQQVNKPVLLANERGKVEAETFVLQIQAINFFWALRVTGMTLQLSQSLSGVMWVSQPASQ